MLCLTRRCNQECVIGRDIRVTVLELRHDWVRLGFEAPRYLPVNRKEVLESRLREGQDIPSVTDIVSELTRLRHENEQLRGELNALRVLSPVNLKE